MLFKICGISPHDFWDYTLAETMQMLEVGSEKLQDDLDFQIHLHADLVVSILNSPFGPYLNGKKYPFKLDDYIRPAKKPEVSEHEKSQRWKAAGDAMMKIVNQHEQDVKKHRR